MKILLLLHTGFRQSLVELAQGNSELRNLMMGILQMGPNVTMDILTAFSDPDNLAVRNSVFCRSNHVIF